MERIDGSMRVPEVKAVILWAGAGAWLAIIIIHQGFR